MKLIIFGSTGDTGRQIVTQALEQGHDVTAFARFPERLDQKHEKLQVIKGNVLDFASLECAIQGQDVMLCTLGLPPMDGFSDIDSGGHSGNPAFRKESIMRSK